MKQFIQLVIVVVTSGMIVIGSQFRKPIVSLASHDQTHPDMKSQVIEVSEDSFDVYLPIISGNPPWISPFGVEPYSPMYEPRLHFTRLQELRAGWVRLGNRISWRDLQPNEGDPIQWDSLATFEQELRDLRGVGVTPVVVITDSPYWATLRPSSCAAIRADKFAAFADFMRQLVNRYKLPEYNLHDWELGNEPDVDPDLVGADNPFGCWGDIDDAYYGGGHYGEMLKVVGQAIKEADPYARVWIGGLLLDRPDSIAHPPICGLPNCGRPELFLEGILESGAAPYFDVVPFHSYTPYKYRTTIYGKVDHDNAIVEAPWYSWGGAYIGKSSFLRQTLQAYGVEKSITLNETSLMCPSEYFSWCNPPGDDFYNAQADFLVRGFVRALAGDVDGVVWYTLEGPGWRYTGLQAFGVPNLAFYSYQQMNNQLHGYRSVVPVDYGSDIEAYAFDERVKFVHVIWAKEDQIFNILVPGEKFIAAYDRDGSVIDPTPNGLDYQLPLGFSPIYIEFSP